MTVQMSDLAARRSADGWIISSFGGGDYFSGGDYQIHLLDEQGDKLRSFELKSALAGFSRFAHATTAGMWWSQARLAYFTAGQRHFVVRAWWGARLVIALDQMAPIDAQGLSAELHRTECELVLDGLRRLVAECESGGQPRFDWPSTDLVHCSVSTLVFFPGLLGLTEAAPLLHTLEELLGYGGSCLGEFRYDDFDDRRLAQTSLRRLGQSPRCCPVIAFQEQEERVALRQPQRGPVDGRTRHASHLHIRSASLQELYRRLGGPDEIAHSPPVWRYDVDADPPYSLLVWLDEHDSVSRILKCLPPLWADHELFPGEWGSPYALDSGEFAGVRIEVDVLQDLEASGRQPVATLARAVLDGDNDALGPLADALEEAFGPQAPQVFATQGVKAVRAQGQR